MFIEQQEKGPKTRLKKGYGYLNGMVYLCVTNRRKPKILYQSRQKLLNLFIMKKIKLFAVSSRIQGKKSSGAEDCNPAYKHWKSLAKGDHYTQLC